MIKKENLDKTSAWPFVEAKKMLRERKSFIEKKGKITLQTGYGPSGLPHIGTFGEVARTSMIVNALNQLTDLPTEIITFSDDMDGLRKVPDNVPQKDLLKNYINNISNTNSLREFVDVEVNKTKKELQKHLSLINDKITKIKLSEAIKQIETLKKGQVVTEKQVLNLMRYYELVKEIKNVHK